MISKSLKKLFFFLALLAVTSASAKDNVSGLWGKSPLGVCYSSLEDYLAETFGAEYKDDENIRISNAFKDTEKYKWVQDITPGVNITRVMFKIENDNRACAILFIPFASTVHAGRRKIDGFLPVKFTTSDSPPPGFAETEVIYRLDTRRQIYIPHQCFKHFSGKRKEKVSCASLYSEIG